MNVQHFLLKVVFFKLNMQKKQLRILGKQNNSGLSLFSTILGVVCKDGIVIGTEKLIVNKMQIPGTDKRLFSINIKCGGVINGLTPDGRVVIGRAREEASQYEENFGVRIPGHVLAERIALKFQMSTVYSSYRPIGTSLVLASHD